MFESNTAITFTINEKQCENCLKTKCLNCQAKETKENKLSISGLLSKI